MTSIHKAADLAEPGLPRPRLHLHDLQLVLRGVGPGGGGGVEQGLHHEAGEEAGPAPRLALPPPVVPAPRRLRPHHLDHVPGLEAQLRAVLPVKVVERLAVLYVVLLGSVLRGLLEADL